MLGLSTMTIHSLYHNEIISYKLMITNMKFIAVAIKYKMPQKKLSYSCAQFYMHDTIQNQIHNTYSNTDKVGNETYHTKPNGKLSYKN